MEMLDSASDDSLQDLHYYLVGENVGDEDTPRAPEPWESGKLRLFVSHLASEQEYVGKIQRSLSPNGVSAFVAHTTIEPSLEWQSVIESGLRTCDAAIALLHEGFRESAWCDQEIGFALARRVPFLPISIEIMPYGFMSKFQALKCRDDPIHVVTEKICKWLVATPSASSAYAEGLVRALEDSDRFAQTRQIYELLRMVPSFTPQQLERLDRATNENSQVKQAVLGLNKIPDLIAALVKAKGGYTTEQATTYAFSEEPPF